MNFNKKNIIFLLGIIVSVSCSWLFVRKVEWTSLNRAFTEAKYIYVIPTIIILFASHYVRSIRWSWLLAPVKRVTIINVFSAIIIGFMANNILPARVGEIIRPLMIGKKENIRLSTVAATVIIERVFDVLSLIVLATATLFLLPTYITKNDLKERPNYTSSTTLAETIKVEAVDKVSGPGATTGMYETNRSTIHQLKKWAGLFTGFGILSILFLFLLSIYPKQASDITKKLLFFLPHHQRDKTIGLIDSFISGLQIFDDKKQIFFVGIVSIVIWVLNVAGIYILGYSFNLGLSFIGACFVTVCLALAVALPQAPGYIGVFHIATQKTLCIFGIDMSSAQSYAILLWAASIIPVTLIGFLLLWREGMGIMSMTKQKDTVLE
ncbi:MAG: flippase-like domain-containing protein [Planctomycetes bacterium]|nr:flippase-like domain-containing protein [Planctomycetota bacterium]